MKATAPPCRPPLPDRLWPIAITFAAAVVVGYAIIAFLVWRLVAR
jgi:hypothetical protein